MKITITIISILFISLFNFMSGQTQILFEEDFENGQGNWSVDNGSWQVGQPSGIPAVFSGNQLAGIVLNDNYPTNANTRLISPEVIIPNIGEDQRIKLKFWHWYQIGFGAEGSLQISTDNGTSWETVTDLFDDHGGAWTNFLFDLSDYQEETIRFAFLFESSIHTPDLGWYVDKIRIFVDDTVFSGSEGFEDEEVSNQWYCTNGLFQFGAPNPCTTPYSGEQVAGTVLSGDYPTNANTRLVSPSISLPPTAELLQLKFWHWYDIGFGAEGYLQISIEGADWENLGGPFDGQSSVWTQFTKDLSAYAGKDIRIAFFFSSSIHTPACGWYIDNFSIEGLMTSTVDHKKPSYGEFHFSVFPNPFEDELIVNCSISEATSVRLSLTNITGTKCYDQQVLNLSGGDQQISLDPAVSLPAGIYLLTLRTAEEIRSIKVVKL